MDKRVGKITNELTTIWRGEKWTKKSYLRKWTRQRLIQWIWEVEVCQEWIWDVEVCQKWMWEIGVCQEWIREYEVLSKRWILRFARSGCRILRFAKEVDNGDWGIARKVDPEFEVCYAWIREFEAPEKWNMLLWLVLLLSIPHILFLCKVYYSRSSQRYNCCIHPQARDIAL